MCCLTVRKDLENQDKLWDVAQEDCNQLRHVEHMEKALPTRLQWGSLELYQQKDRTFVGVPRSLLDLAEDPEKGALSLDGTRLMWSGDGQQLYLSGYRPWKEAVFGRWKVLQSVDWSAKDEES